MPAEADREQWRKAMTDDLEDEPGRLEMPALQPSRKALKFGFGKCPWCDEKFTRQQHKQRYCRPEHQRLAAEQRAGRLSDDPRWVAKRKRQARLAALQSVSDPRTRGSTAGPRKCQKKPNENNTLQGAESGSRMAFASILEIELWNVPLVAVGYGGNLGTREWRREQRRWWVED